MCFLSACLGSCCLALCLSKKPVILTEVMLFSLLMTAAGLLFLLPFRAQGALKLFLPAQNLMLNEGQWLVL